MKLNINRKLKLVVEGIIVIVLFFNSFTTVFSSSPYATLSLKPSNNTILINNFVTVDFNVSSTTQAVNTYSSIITFDKTYLKPISINKNGSICTIYIEDPEFNNNTVTYICGHPNPGYKGSSGKIGSITFQAIKEGKTTISIDQNSRVLANDGNGTDIFTGSQNAIITIVRSTKKLETPKVYVDGVNSGDWVNFDDIVFKWNLIDGASGYSFSLSTNPETNPDSIVDTKELLKSFNDLEDGVYYFKLLATDGINSSDIQTFIIKIDTTKPENLKLIFNTCNPEITAYQKYGKILGIECGTFNADNDVILNASPILEFSAEDFGSGIEKYSFSLDGKDFIDTNDIYLLKTIKTGQHKIIVRAYDKAGNYLEKEYIFNVIDVITPDLEIEDDKTKYNKGDKIEISGNAEKNSTVLIYVDGVLISVTKSDSNGNYTFIIDLKLDLGEHEIYTQTITEGNVLSNPSNIINIEIVSGVFNSLFEKGFLGIPNGCYCCILLILLLLLVILFVRRRKKKEEENQKSNEVYLNKVKKSAKKGSQPE